MHSVYRSAIVASAFLFTACCSGFMVGHAEEPLVIESAVYGDLPDGKSIKVSRLLNERIKDGKLRVEVSNDLFGDPAESVGKKLRVEYRHLGKTAEVTIAEGETLLLPPPKLAGDLRVVKAEYGALPDGSKEDVTDIVRRHLKDNQIEIPVTNDLFGDPASGEFKRLRVEYTIGDVSLAKSTYEGGTLRISVPKETEPK